MSRTDDVSGFLEIPSDDVLTNCMHCGLCLPVCPTYESTGLEKSSPRGRIRLIKHVASGKSVISSDFANEMNFCLDCQACETACPAGVKYGSLVVAARAMIFESPKESLFSRTVKRFFLGTVFGSRRRLRVLGKLLGLYQRSGLAWFAEYSGILRLLSKNLGGIHQLTPRASEVFSTEVLTERMPAFGERRFTVGFLPGCIMDIAFAGINIETVELLRKVGCEVVTPASQACCGSLAAHNGDTRSARTLALNTIEAFEHEEMDFIVMNSAGCGAFMKEYGEVFRDDPRIRERAERIASKTTDLTEFLVHIGWKPAESSAETEVGLPVVTYHDACHLAHGQRVAAQPRALLKRMKGISYVELPDASWCCGSAGIYNVVRYDDSMTFLDRKIRTIRAIDPDIVLTGNPGCMLQIEHGLRQSGLKARVMHTATFLNRST